MIRAATVLVGLVAAAACTPVPPSFDQATARCSARAEAAAGPQGSVTLGVNSESGGFASSAISVSGDALRGLDPAAVYQACMLRAGFGETQAG